MKAICHTVHHQSFEHTGHNITNLWNTTTLARLCKVVSRWTTLHTTERYSSSSPMCLGEHTFPATICPLGVENVRLTESSREDKRSFVPLPLLQVECKCGRCAPASQATNVTFIKRIASGSDNYPLCWTSLLSANQAVFIKGIEALWAFDPVKWRWNPFHDRILTTTEFWPTNLMNLGDVNMNIDFSLNIN